ncbi:Aspartic proteinase nepenthesin-1 [Dendrobium catenatum]|uniref:Aspartic proteinase nepenthesin-1 n=1 Tax=Dendrobium catenatum TaxID=906689 RepID=A0A2I0V789_9ASPA|nr:Aspartic proteinase nepenthesin-1 [Dendrobium catenatum]
MFYTGSDLTWTQCVPCINCYNQKNPFYDPTQSSTFTTIECISDYCCLYEVRYADHSITKGSLINDTLKFSNDNIPNFHFGCGDNNTGFHGDIDGFLGLGRGSLSIISQASNMYNNIFSYCLPSALGVKYTPMVTNPKMPSFYFLNLTAIFIWGERIDLSPTIFSSPGTILDSGTTFTRLPPTTYFALRSIFRKKWSITQWHLHNLNLTHVITLLASRRC